MSYIDIDNKNIFYEIINQNLLQKDKPLLVFLHEGLGCSEQWKNFYVDISQKTDLPILAYDRYGYGMSQEIVEKRDCFFLEYEAKYFLSKLFELLNLKNYKKILFGHSDGGTISLLYANYFPNEVVGIITEVAHVFVEKITIDGLKEVLKLYNDTNLKQKLEKYHFNKTDNMFYSWINIWLSGQMDNWNIENLLKNITCPVLAIQGKNDNYGSSEQLEKIKKNINSDVTTILLDNCGHIPHLHLKKEIEKITVEFILKILQ